MATKVCSRCGGAVERTSSGYVHKAPQSPACQLEGVKLLALETRETDDPIHPTVPSPVDWREVALDHAREIRELRQQNQHLLDRNNELVAERRSGIRAKVR